MFIMLLILSLAEPVKLLVAPATWLLPLFVWTSSMRKRRLECLCSLDVDLRSLSNFLAASISIGCRFWNSRGRRDVLRSLEFMSLLELHEVLGIGIDDVYHILALKTEFMYWRFMHWPLIASSAESEVRLVLVASRGRLPSQSPRSAARRLGRVSRARRRLWIRHVAILLRVESPIHPQVIDDVLVGPLIASIRSYL